MLLVPGLQAQVAASGGFSDSLAIEQRLQQTQSELREHAADTDSLTYELLKRLETTIYHHQAAVAFKSAKESERESALAATRSWGGFDQPGPYPILFSDELRLRLIELQHFQSAAEVRLRILIQFKTAAAEQFTRNQTNERQLIESAELADSEESRQKALLAVEQNAILLRIDVEKVAYVDLRIAGVQAEIDAFQTGQELIQLQLKATDGQLVFSQSELDEILQRIASERRWAIETLESPGTVEQEYYAQIAWLAEFLDVEEVFWHSRFEGILATDLAERNKTLASFMETKRTIDTWAQFAQSKAGDRLLVPGDSSDPLVLRDEFQRIKRLQHQIDFAVSDLEKRAGPGVSILGRVLEGALAIWNSELYLVEDTASHEGKKVSTFRAITFGKLVKLAFILVAGWLALKFLSRRLRTLATRYLGASPATVNTIVRWNFGVGLGLLIIYSLKSVNIPFTAFAFLGGTLAIGIGFGAQTLIKNFISGLIILLERPFKVGDLIEVDDVTGRILRIGMRASVIEHFDGVETLIPNSLLLDSRVNNWTFGKTAIRGSVNVGVAYGSPTREVSRTLLAAATKHGQVLERPEPEVRFEDFGDSSLIFRLLYWVDATQTQRERLDSDLRFMIERALNEVGITLAFPQRDIHFDTARPLKVEIASHPGQLMPESTGK
jgi:small-conductance mechanosensitive channel